MDSPLLALSAVLKLVRAMFVRAAHDSLAPDHPMRVRARELDDACEMRFEMRPPQCSIPHYVDCYIRAYAAWHTYTGLDDVA